MPVRVAADALRPGTLITLAADGAVPTELDAGGGKTDAVVPWLAVGEVGEPKWSVAGRAAGSVATPLKPLGEDERLVALAGEGHRTRDAAVLFPGKVVVTVRLDLSRPLLVPAAAYESLDGLLLDAGAAARVDESQLAILAAGGTAVAVRSDARPAGSWPWRREGAYWVLRYNPVGPRSVVEPDAYQPTYGWARGWPAAFRRRVMLGVALFGIVALALTLWRSRVLAAGGAVVVSDGRMTQRDEWTYRTVLRPADVSVPVRGISHVVLHGRQQLDSAGVSGVRLVCAADGGPDRFVGRLEADHALAVVSRSVRPGPAAGVLAGRPTVPVTSPLVLLANQLYPGRVVGEVNGGTSTEADGQPWGAVLVDGSAANP
jgi:hypothetical protein